MSKILVTGANGNIGSRVVKLLTQRGEHVRAMVRSPEKARFDPSVEIATGDLRDADRVRAAMQGIEKVFLLSNATGLEETDAIAVDAARDAGVSFIVKQSVNGAPLKATLIPIIHRLGEERIEQSGMKYVFLRPTAFQSNALGWINSIKSEGKVYGSLADAAVAIIHPEDIAEVAAAVLTSSGHENHAYELTGPEALTTKEQVEILAKAIGRPLEYVNLTDDQVRGAMLAGGAPESIVDGRVGLMKFIRESGGLQPSKDVKAVTGRDPRPFADWVEENISAFR